MGSFIDTTDLFKSQLSGKQHRLTDEELEELKKVTLEILDDVVFICKEKNIPYMLGGGTALGAIRHKGFIPWDDDIDINIERQYIEELVGELNNRFGDKYYVESPTESDGYFSLFYQVHKKGTVFREFLAQKEEHCGIKIDIFPIENTYDNGLRRWWHGVSCEFGMLCMSCYRMFLWRKEFYNLSKGNKKASMVIHLKAYIGALFYPFGKFLYKRVYNCLRKCKNNRTKYVVIPSGRRHFFGELAQRERYLKYQDVLFENRIYSISKDYDEYLKNLYGDYMKIPEEKDREHHVLYELKF